LIALVIPARAGRDNARAAGETDPGRRSRACRLILAGPVIQARRPNPIPSRTRPLNASAPMVLCLKTRESRSSPDPPRSEALFATVNAWPRAGLGAGWSSPVARQAHNLKVTGSNPVPATNTLTTPHHAPPHRAARAFASRSSLAPTDLRRRCSSGRATVTPLKVSNPRRRRPDVQRVGPAALGEIRPGG
jgi:hypothetical protein